MVTPESIKAARVARGLTQAALAALMGVPSMAISRYERGATRPRGLYLEKLMSVLPEASTEAPVATGTEG